MSLPPLSHRLNFAIVVLSYNHPELTARAVNSALKLHENVYLVHNGSEKKFSDSLKSQFTNITHLYLEKNLGYSGGVNFGLRCALQNSAWAILLTNDCVMQNLPKIPLLPALIGPHILIQKSLRTDSLGGIFNPPIGRISHCKSLTDFANAKFKYIPGSAFLIHRKIFQDTGPFDEALGTYWEDVDFSQRVQQNGHPLQVDPEWRIEHGRGKTCHKHRHYTLYLFQRNRKRISKKYTEFIYKPILFINLWMTWIKLSLRLVFNSRFQDLRLLLRAIKD